MHAHLGARDQPQLSFFRLRPPCLLRQSLSLAWISSSRLSQLANKSQGPSHFQHSRVWLQTHAKVPYLSTWLLGIALGSSCTCSKQTNLPQLLKQNNFYCFQLPCILRSFVAGGSDKPVEAALSQGSSEDVQEKPF